MVVVHLRGRQETCTIIVTLRAAAKSASQTATQVCYDTLRLGESVSLPRTYVAEEFPGGDAVGHLGAGRFGILHLEGGDGSFPAAHALESVRDRCNAGCTAGGTAHSGPVPLALVCSIRQMRVRVRACACASVCASVCAWACTPLTARPHRLLELVQLNDVGEHVGCENSRESGFFTVLFLAVSVWCLAGIEFADEITVE